MDFGNPKLKSFAIFVFCISSTIALLPCHAQVKDKQDERQKKIDKLEQSHLKLRNELEQIIILGNFYSQYGKQAKIPERLKELVNEKHLKLSEEALWQRHKSLLTQWEKNIKELITYFPKMPEYKFQLAEIATQQRDFEKRKKILDELAPPDRPGYYLAQLQVGVEYMQKKKLDKARLHLGLALKSAPEHFPTKYYLIQVLIASEDYQAAEKLLKENYRKHLIRYPGLFRFASAIANGTNDPKILETYRQLTIEVGKKHLQKEPSSKFWPLVLDCYSQLKKHDEAEKLLLEAISNEKNDQQKEMHQHYLGMIYRYWAVDVGYDWNDTAKIDPYLKLLKKSQKYSHNHPQTLRLLAHAALGPESELSRRAKKIYDPMKDPDPPAGVHTEISHKYLSRMSSYQKAKKTDDANAMRDKAIDHLRKSYKKNPNDSQVCNNLAFLLIQQGESRIDEALLLSGQALARESKSSPVAALSNYYDTHGTVLMAKGKSLVSKDEQNSKKIYKLAIEALKKSLVGRPKNVKAMKRLVECYRAIGDDKSADAMEKQIADQK